MTKTSRTVTVRGRVTPSAKGKVAATLFRKRGGAFVRVAAKSGTLTRSGTFATSFARPRPGVCKATVRYGGDANHRPSQATTTFRC